MAEGKLDRQAVREFFDSCAPTWDAEMIKDDRKIGLILENASVREGKDILDVACGTGVLIPYYLERKAASVTAIDISPKMCGICAGKFRDMDGRVRVICGDAETEDFGRLFDVIVIYNAFPHFSDPDTLIARLSSFLKTGGSLTVTHGMSREKVDSHHSGTASMISNGLMEADELANLFRKHLNLKLVISNDTMYQVVGTKK